MSAMFSSSSDAESKRKADALVAALVGMGVPSRVESRGQLAVLKVPAASMSKLSDPAVRRSLLALAREHGFSHVAVELDEHASADAALLRP